LERELDALGGPVVACEIAGQVERAIRAVGELCEDQARSRRVQVDLYRNWEGLSLSDYEMSLVERAVDAWCQYRSPKPSRPLASFLEAFERRYGAQEVGLLEAVDPDLGPGFRSFVDESEYGLPRHMFEQAEETPLSERWMYLQHILTSSIEAGDTEIDAEKLDAKRLGSLDCRKLPDSLSVAFVLLNDPSGGRRILLQGITGPSGARILGRFCGGDRALRDCVKQYLTAEEALAPECCFAELLHIPEGRPGNVIARPVMRKHEVAYLATASDDPEIIPLHLDDLKLSVRDGRFFLRSASMDREVRPRITSAHNFSHSSALPVYSFLGLLQQQEVVTGEAWDWGPLARSSFLPRVVHGRTVLSRCAWNVSRTELPAFRHGLSIDAYNQVNAWRIRRRIPRVACLTDADNELAIDFASVHGVAAFLSLVDDKTGFTIREPVFTLGESPVGELGIPYANEFVLPFLRQKSRAREQPYRATDLTRQTWQHTFHVGDKWTYLKAYCGKSAADTLIRDVFPGFVSRMRKDLPGFSWFFVRYSDPDWHLRIRVYCEEKRKSQQVLDCFTETIRHHTVDGVIWKTQLDSYQRETHRYGGAEGMLLAENVFSVDSDAALQLLFRAPSKSLRWRVCIMSADALLRDLLGDDLSMLLATISLGEKRWCAALGTSDSVRGVLASRYRKCSNDVRSLLDPAAVLDPNLQSLRGILKTRSHDTAGLFDQHRSLLRTCRCTQSRESLILSFLHMSLNRLLFSASAGEEIVLYHFLGRHYRSELARHARQEAGIS
jgi:thiopeptide-type bacteriocin biosynthesis protein